jgi:hypothetical protein
MRASQPLNTLSRWSTNLLGHLFGMLYMCPLPNSTEYLPDLEEHKSHSATTRRIYRGWCARAHCAIVLLEDPGCNVVRLIGGDEVTGTGWTDHPASELMAAALGILLEAL